MRENKTEFIIIRVTKSLKDKLIKEAIKAELGFSNFIRKILNENK